MLRVDLTKTFEQLTIEARFSSAGGVTALFGPSGAGKTSIINMIAGLLPPDRGEISLDGETLDDTARRIHVPTHRRRIGYVFQDARLFPHLSVASNLDYGRRMNGLSVDHAETRRIISLLDLDGLLDRRPGKLSGGEKQRVALGRALLSRPRLLLLDEPLGSLDEERKADILPYLMRLRDQAAVPMIFVSHSADEVRRLATQVIQLQHGQIVAQGGTEILGAAGNRLRGNGG
jgi:molybdate transport system ATP-binding protein